MRISNFSSPGIVCIPLIESIQEGVVALSNDQHFTQAPFVFYVGAFLFYPQIERIRRVCVYLIFRVLTDIHERRQTL